ncbi:DUF2533 family protein [Fictibacillus iocasae]|uniref:DUF2533 family protein n=1 Tax=Fictibacillus iocasae TaxID=2715437 RepID=A0ABW2NMS2_9BACL
MEVHKQISSHSEKQHTIVKAFLYYDELREQYIEKAVNHAIHGEPFSVEDINSAAEKINEIAAANGITPSRIIVTKEMIDEYAKKKQRP